MAATKDRARRPVAKRTQQQQQRQQTKTDLAVTPQQLAPIFGGKSGRRGQPAAPECPDCKRPMKVKQVTPVLFATGLDDVSYTCESCGTLAKRTVKRPD